MIANELPEEDEISLFDLWQRLRVGWRSVLGGAATGTLVAGISIVAIPPKYEAIAVVQVGQVGQVGQVVGQPIEPATQAVERMKTHTFQLTVAEAAGDQDWIDDLKRSSDGLSKYLSVQVLKSTVGQGAFSLIELKAKASSPERARKIADVSILDLAKAQSALAQPTIDKMRIDLALTKQKLASAEQDLEGLNKLVATAAVREDRFTQLSLMTSLRLQKEADLYSQRQLVMALETALAAPATQAAKAIEAVYVSDVPVFPKKGLLISLGLIGGLLLGMVSVFIGDAWRSAKAQRDAQNVG